MGIKMLLALETINVWRCYIPNSSLVLYSYGNKGTTDYWQGEYAASQQRSPTLATRGDKRGVLNGSARYSYPEKTHQKTAVVMQAKH